MARTLRVALLTLGDPDRLTGGYLFHRRMAERAAAHGARIEFLSFPDRPSPLSMLPAMLAAPALLRRAHMADAIVVDSIVAAYLAPTLALRRPRAPLVAMLHQPPGGIDSGPARTWLQAQLDRMTYRHAARLMVASETLREPLLAAGTPAGRIRLVAPGCDGAAGIIEPAAELRQGRCVALLCVANWLPQKDILSVLDALARLPDDAITLHLVGDTLVDPGYAARVRARLATLELALRVVVHGPLAPARVAGMYAAADAFVLASRKEPYGTVVGEALAAGLPVIGWRAGNLPQLVEDGSEGLLVAPGELAGLAEAMRRIAEDDELRRRLGAAAHERARSLPTWDDAAALFFATLREVAQAPSRQ